MAVIIGSKGVFLQAHKLGGGWKLGGGAEAKGERYGYNPSGAGAIPTLPGSSDFHPNTAPAYVRWDALVGYEQPTYRVYLNVQNLFDTVYYDALYDNGGLVGAGAGPPANPVGRIQVLTRGTTNALPAQGCAGPPSGVTVGRQTSFVVG